MEEIKRSRLASFLHDSGICSPQDLAKIEDQDAPEALLEALVAQGSLSADQSAVLKQMALIPWFREQGAVRGKGPSTGSQDFKTFWAGAPLGADERYTERTLHAQGGMGRVIRAYDAGMRREVAIKELLPEVYHLAGADSETLPRGVGSNLEAVQRFLNEARITGQLEHPAIVPVYEIGTQPDGSPYYTMKLVRGQSLADAIRGARSPDARLKLLPHFIDLCQAIAFAHSRGVIHRDIKPSNVLLGEFGETMVVDWGLAKSREAEGAPPVDPASGEQLLQTDSGRTMMGQVLGTPIYMAPEQARGALDEIDERSDVYSLGVVLYEILTGTTPYANSKPETLLALKQTQSPPPVRVRDRHAPPELAAICEHALQPKADHRYQSAVELADEVQRFLSGSLVQAYQYSAGEQVLRIVRRYKVTVTVAVAALLVIVAVAATSYVNVLGERDAAMAATAREAAARAEAVAALEETELARAAAASSEAQMHQELYFRTIGLAHTHILAGEYTRARHLLLGILPPYRGWEWSWLMFQAHPDLAAWPSPPMQPRQVDIPPEVHWESGKLILSSFKGGLRQSFLHDIRQRTMVAGTLVVNIPMQGSHILPGGERAIQVAPNAAYLMKLHAFDSIELAATPIYLALDWAPSYADDAGLALFATQYRNVGVFDTDDLTLLREFECAYGITNALLLGGARRVLTAHQPPFIAPTEEANFTLWSLDSGAALATYDGFQAHPAAADAQGTTFALTRTDGAVVLFHGENGARGAVLEQPAHNAAALAFAGQAPVLAVASRDGTVSLHEAATGALRQQWAIGQTPCVVTADALGTKVAVGTDDGMVYMLDASGVRPLAGHEGRIRSLSFCHEAICLAVADEHDLRIWNLASPGATTTTDARLRDATLAHDGQTIIARRLEGGIGAWCAHSGRLKEMLVEEDAPESSPVFGPAGTHYLARTTNSVRLVQVEDGAISMALEGSDFLHSPTAFSADGNRVAFIMTDTMGSVSQAQIVVVDISRGGVGRQFSLRHIAEGADAHHAAIAFSARGERVFAAHGSTLTVYDAETGEVVRVSPIESVHMGIGNAAALSPDGRQFVASGQRGGLVLSGSKHGLGAMDAHAAQVTAIAFDPTGERMLTGAADGTLKVWDVDSGRELLPLPPQDEPIRRLVFNARDGSLLVHPADSAARVLHVLGWGVNVTDALPGMKSEEQWSLYRTLHPQLARPAGLCNVAAQERLLTELGYSREEALGILAPLYPAPASPDAACDSEYAPFNRVFLHTIADLMEREQDPHRRQALKDLALRALDGATNHPAWARHELGLLAEELLQAQPPKAKSALAFAKEGVEREGSDRIPGIHGLSGILCRAYIAAGEWEAARTILAGIDEDGSGKRQILWAQVMAAQGTLEDLREAAAALEAYLIGRLPDETARAVYAALKSSPHASAISNRVERLGRILQPEPAVWRTLAWRDDLADALKEAAERETIVLLAIESQETPGKKFEDHPVLAREDVVELIAAHTVPVRIDAGPHTNLLSTYNLTRLPALVAMNRSSEVLWRAEPEFDIFQIQTLVLGNFHWPGAIRVFDIAGPIPLAALGQQEAEQLVAAVSYPEPFTLEGELYPWWTCPITTIENRVELDKRFGATAGQTFVATAAVKITEETQVRIQGSFPDGTYLFANADLLKSTQALDSPEHESRWFHTTLRAGENRLTLVLSTLQHEAAFRMAVVAADGAPLPGLTFGPVLNERFPAVTLAAEQLETHARVAETLEIHLQKNEILHEWRAINADFMRNARLLFVEMDHWGVGVKFENASEFVLARMFGLRDGDILVGLNDISFSDPTALMAALDAIDGQVIPEWQATVLRGGREVRITILVGY